MAKSNGWRSAANTTSENIHKNQKKNTAKKSITPLEIWERCLPAPADHPYIIKKQGSPDALRYYPSTETELIICRQNVADYLVVPCWSKNEIQTLQFISPETGKKLNLTDGSFNDGYFIVGIITDTIYICEGIGHAWAINKVSGATAIVCFSFWRMKRVAKVIRKQHPNAQIKIV